MNHLSAALALGALLLVVAPASAEDKEYDLGFARPGMMLGQLRYRAWPGGTKMFCGGDTELPKPISEEGQKILHLPRPYVHAGIVRCGLFAQDAKGTWEPQTTKLAGNPADFSATAISDEGGMQRVVQLTFWQKKEFAAETVAEFKQRFGKPYAASDEATQWLNGRYQAVIASDQAEGVHIFVSDNKLQDKLKLKLGEPVKKK